MGKNVLAVVSSAIVLAVVISFSGIAMAATCAPESKGLEVYACKTEMSKLKSDPSRDYRTCTGFIKVEPAAGCEYGPFDSSAVNTVFVFAKLTDKDKIKNEYFNVNCDNKGLAGLEFESVPGFMSGVGGDLDYLPDYSLEKFPTMSAGDRRDKAKNDFEKKGKYLIKRIKIASPPNAESKQFNKQTCEFANNSGTMLIKLNVNIK